MSKGTVLPQILPRRSQTGNIILLLVKAMPRKCFVFHFLLYLCFRLIQYIKWYTFNLFDQSKYSTLKLWSGKIRYQISVAGCHEIYICLFLGFLVRTTMSGDLHFKIFNLTQLVLGNEKVTFKGLFMHMAPLTRDSMKCDIFSRNWNTCFSPKLLLDNFKYCLNEITNALEVM